MPATTTMPTSHHGACCGLPPRRSSHRSTGVTNGSVRVRMSLASPLKGLIVRVRTAQDPSAISRLAAKATKTA
jgi:hypothetical protein